MMIMTITIIIISCAMMLKTFMSIEIDCDHLCHAGNDADDDHGHDHFPHHNDFQVAISSCRPDSSWKPSPRPYISTFSFILQKVM